MPTAPRVEAVAAPRVNMVAAEGRGCTPCEVDGCPHTQWWCLPAEGAACRRVVAADGRGQQRLPPWAEGNSRAHAAVASEHRSFGFLYFEAPTTVPVGVSLAEN
ncbi:hypothetical protein MUK42_36293 [Musa troglodytarum]|uniref:Uncharacterized protein n=1 Tax=Musa troglodytarum TaxID=320322 RepID=A0A9E7FHU0_9LILI|nr:hypothetical protein MUK42_36293 [Musa troglodytarum]